VPFTDDDDAIAAALADVSVPTLLMSLVHVTGSTAILDELPKPAGIYLNEVQGFMAPEDQATVRARAVEVLAAYRDGGCVLPPPPSGEDLRTMMEVLVAGPVGEEYLGLILEELGLGGDARGLSERTPADDGVLDDLPDGFHALIIGAGMSGLLAAIRFEAAGIPYTVVEKNPDVGGTWFENRYPGCRVDVGNHFYCYSFAPNDDWTRFFATHEELQAYFAGCADRFGVRDHVRFGTEVVRAAWDEADDAWHVELRPAPTRPTSRDLLAPGATPDDPPIDHGTGDGGDDPGDGHGIGAGGGPGGVAGETVRATILVSAVGQLNRPKLPDVEGVEAFEGEWCHSARWPEDLELAGKRVGVVGSGASAFQIVPTIAPEVGHLSVFQRSAPWMFENPHYHDEVGEGVSWALRHLPFYGRWYRFLLFWPGCDGGLPAMRIDPEWPHQDRAVSEVNDITRELFTQYLLDQIDDDPALAEQVVPDYVCLGKRTLQDNGSWLAALQRDDVDLVTDPIVAVDATGIRTGAGHHELDVIVYATGFEANRFLWPMEIVGRDGVTLAERWGDEPAALFGITVPGFPNLFCLYGPGTNLATGGSLIFHSECQVRYLTGCLALMAERGWAPLEPTEAALEAYDEALRAELDTMIWSHPSITHSWYRNEAGHVRVLSPWRLCDYWAWTRAPDPTHYGSPAAVPR
jgi:4-hydroxyacetophenone monooxygenase